MQVSGFDMNTLRKVFDSFLNDTQLKDGKRRMLNTRVVSYTGIGNVANLSFNEMKKENEQFQNDMALLYIKTFYGRTAENFKTIEYKMESERFNLFIRNYPNRNELHKNIQRCLRKNSVDFLNEELPKNLFYDRLKFGNIGLYSDDMDHRLFITPNFATHARIYINPSMNNYRHLLMYILRHVAHRELGVGFKTRMDKIKTTNSLNNLILYTNDRDFPILIEILNNYGKVYPDKVGEFGDTVATLGRAKNDWFGFGFEPQRSNTENIGLTTFNSAIDDMFNNYVLTAAMLDDFNKITAKLKLRDLIKIFRETKVANNDETAKDMVLSLYDNKLTSKIINNFCSLSYVRNTSLAINKDNEKIPVNKRRGLSPSQIRDDKRKPSDITLLNNQFIEYPLYDGGLIMVTRRTLAQLLKSPLLRDCMMRFYNTTDENDKQVAQMAWLWNYLGKNLPYLNSGCPFLSDDLVKSIKARMNKEEIRFKGKAKEEKIVTKIQSKEKEHINTVKLLCSNNRVLASSIREVEKLHPADLRNLDTKDLQKKVITTIGLDKVIESVEYFKSQQKDVTELYKFETALIELRQERGMQLVEQLKSINTKRERDRIAEQLSRFAREDIVREYQNEKAMQKFDDFIRTLYY